MTIQPRTYICEYADHEDECHLEVEAASFEDARKKLKIIIENEEPSDYDLQYMAITDPSGERQVITDACTVMDNIGLPNPAMSHREKLAQAKRNRRMERNRKHVAAGGEHPSSDRKGVQ